MCLSWDSLVAFSVKKKMVSNNDWFVEKNKKIYIQLFGIFRIYLNIVCFFKDLPYSMPSEHVNIFVK